MDLKKTVDGTLRSKYKLNTDSIWTWVPI